MLHHVGSKVSTGREGKGREGKGREGKGREGKGREGKGREGTLPVSINKRQAHG